MGVKEWNPVGQSGVLNHLYPFQYYIIVNSSYPNSRSTINTLASPKGFYWHFSKVSYKKHFYSVPQNVSSSCKFMSDRCSVCFHTKVWRTSTGCRLTISIFYHKTAFDVYAHECLNNDNHFAFRLFLGLEYQKEELDGPWAYLISSISR